MRHAKLTAALAAACLSASAFSAPLLMEGKQSIYQRVLTTPACVLKKNAAAKSGEPVPALTRYYVYAREGDALKVGPDTSDKISGYIDSSCAVDWKEQTALLFTNPAGRTRTAIFEKQDNLQKLVDSKNSASEIKAVNAKLDKGSKVDGVIAREPETYVDYKKKFYLLPVLSSEETMFDDGTYTRELEVASVTQEGMKQGANSAADPSKIKAFKAALVFVIDSSISMQPYIDRTKQAIQGIYKKLEKAHLQNSVSFGLVSFRSSTKAVPGLEYVSKMFVNPGEAKSAEDFEKKLRNLSQAKVSSKLFDEDAYAGINTALNKVDWNDYGGRYIVLITDAGAISGSDKLSSTRLDSKQLRLEAEHQGAAIYALHLLTPSGEKAGDHDKAKAQYEDLTFNSVLQKPLYYPVEAGSVDSFGKMVDSLSSAIASQVKLASEGKLGAGSSTAQAPEDKQGQGSMDEDTRLLGNAMALAYLGRETGAAAPAFIRGWVSDRDLADHQKISATPVVLLTKSQLSDLKEVTSRVLEAANKGILSPDDMFSQLRSVAASMGRDPNALKQDKTLKLGQMGLLGEYLDDLPYKSRLQELDEETWSSMGPDEQNRAIEDLENKLVYYQQCNDDTDRWVKLAPDADAAESVYPIQLEALP
ncbi:MAG: vWA domain-containing protein [Succinivibrio sp.]|jgi:hypothetical protein|nr:vWA domain-containing protein [Succinivibrio sp.]